MQLMIRDPLGQTEHSSGDVNCRALVADFYLVAAVEILCVTLAVTAGSGFVLYFYAVHSKLEHTHT